jgi:quinol monooxygenase YgiN
MKTTRRLWLPLLAGALTVHSAAADEVYLGRAVLVVKPQYLSAFRAEVEKILEPTRREAGNISYEAFQVVNEKGEPTNRFEFHELWKSKKAMLVDHKEHSLHMQRFFRRVRIGEPDSWVESFDLSGSEVRPM